MGKFKVIPTGGDPEHPSDSIDNNTMLVTEHTERNKFVDYDPTPQGDEGVETEQVRPEQDTSIHLSESETSSPGVYERKRPIVHHGDVANKIRTQEIRGWKANEEDT